MVAESGCEEAKAEESVGDGEVAEHVQFFFDELVTFTLEDMEVDCPAEEGFQLWRVPWFMDVLIDGSGIDRIDGGFHVGVGRDEDAEDSGLDLAGLFEQPDAGLAGHPLVAQEDGDIVSLALDDFEGFGGGAGGEDGKGVGEGAFEAFEGHFLIIDVEDGVFLVICCGLHGVLGLGGFGGGEADLHFGELSGFAGDGELALELLDDTVADAQAEAQAFADLLGGKERVEDLVLDSGVDAGAVVGDG